jgi:CBS-domain-containing membrane protein
MLQGRGHLSLRTRVTIWRARLSTPALLTRFDEAKVVSVVAAAYGGLAILTISLFAWLIDLPLLFPALGPTAFILFTAPLSRAAAPRSVILGHLISLIVGFAVWHLVNLLGGGSAPSTDIGWPLLLGASVALAISSILMIRFACPHPPACASCLIVTLSVSLSPIDVLLMALAVCCLAGEALVMNRFAGLPVPTWAPRKPEPEPASGRV